MIVLENYPDYLKHLLIPSPALQVIQVRIDSINFPITVRDGSRPTGTVRWGFRYQGTCRPIIIGMDPIYVVTREYHEDQVAIGE